MPEALALVGPRLRAPAGGAARLRGQASSVFIRDRSRERGHDCYSKSKRMLLRLLVTCNFLISTTVGAEDPRRRFLSGLGSPRDIFPSSKARKELGRQHAERKTKTQRALSLASLFLPPSSDWARKIDGVSSTSSLLLAGAAGSAVRCVARGFAGWHREKARGKQTRTGRLRPGSRRKWLRAPTGETTRRHAPVTTASPGIGRAPRPRAPNRRRVGRNGTGQRRPGGAIAETIGKAAIPAW
jgi:hypothetical protein